MKKYRIKLIAVIAVVCVGVLLGRHFLKDDSRKAVSEEKEEEDKDNAADSVIAEVLWGSLENSYIGEGVVISDEAQICDTYYVELDKAVKAAPLIVKKGKYLDKGDVIFCQKKNKIVAPSDGQVVDLVETDDSIQITVLNYSKLLVSVKVPYDCYAMLTYDTPVSIIADGKKIDAKISDIDYIYDESGIEILVSINEYVMPNKKVKVNFELGKTEEILFIPAGLVNTMGDYNFVYRICDDKTEQVEITLGRRITVYENDDFWDYYEIIDGLQSGDMIITEEIGEGE